MSNSASRKRAAEQRHRRIHQKFQALALGTGSRFVADVMLGRLAKWLRIAGMDTLYSNRYTDDQLIALSLEDRRILLSRDTRLLVRKAVTRFIYLESDDVQSQIEHVLRTTGVRQFPALLTRCLSCNDVLKDIDREQVRRRVPPYVLVTQPRFKTCPACGRIYWAGTHRRAVLRTLNKFLGAAAKEQLCDL
jgi:uncharacterized protein with PIN domain